MSSFKDVFIKDARSEGARKLQVRFFSLETKRHLDLQSSQVESSSAEEEIPDIDEVKIPECERFENLFLIGKTIGESVLLKTISSKAID